MPLLQLADHTVFDDTDDAGVILDNRRGIYLSLNASATLMLRAALRYDTVDEAANQLRDELDASAETLRAGIGRLITQLDEHALLARGHRDHS